MSAVGRAVAVSLRDLHKSFGALEVLKGISLTAREGEVVSILGASGSGKSTLLRCINLLEIPDAGEQLLNSLEHEGEIDQARTIPLAK